MLMVNSWNVQNPDTGLCRVAVQPLQGSDPRAIFGAVFTKAWYTLYDLNDSPGSYVGKCRVRSGTEDANCKNSLCKIDWLALSSSVLASLPT